MDKIKFHIRKNKTLTNFIIALIGIIVIIVGGNLKSKNMQNISMGIGTSFLASAIIVLITSALVEDDSESEIRLKKWGIEAIYSTRSEMNISCDHYLQNAKTIDVIAFGLRSWRDSQAKLIKKLLKEGCMIRILTMDPDCENLKQREKDELQEEGSIGFTIRQLTNWAEKLNKKGYTGKITIKYYNAQPLNFMFLMDNRLFCGPYEYGKGSQQTISYEFSKNGDAYSYYSDYFDSLWENQAFCSEKTN